MFAGVILFVFTLIFGRSYLSLSLPLLTHGLAGQPVPAGAFMWKILFVSVTLGMGMSGGIITPLFVIGASLGAMLSGPLHLPAAAGAELGMIAVTAGGANVPIAAVIMGMELFGPGLALYFLAAAIPAYIVIGNHSVYPSQLLEVVKSPLVPVRLGGCLEDNESVDEPNIR
jgi:H+/Cl- antiporter ClcA